MARFSPLNLTQLALRVRNRLGTLNVMGRLTAFYKRLLALAELHGDATQRDIAGTVGVSPAAVTGWKDGTLPQPAQIKQIAAAYDADPLELMRIAYLSDGEPKARRGAKTPIAPRQSL